MYNYVNRTAKTTLNTGVPFLLFISLQLHTRKYGKVSEIGAIPLGVKVLGGRLKNERKWKSVDIGGNRCEKYAKCFPDISPNQMEMGKLSANNK